MTGSIYKNGVFYGEPNMSVKYYDNPQDYYDLPKAEREAMTELVILNEDDNPLDASLITYGDGSVAEALDELNEDYEKIDSATSAIRQKFNDYYKMPFNTIPSTGDWNSLSVGFWATGDYSNSAKQTNKPISETIGLLVVLPGFYDTVGTQIYFANYASDVIYIRNKFYTSSWGSWKKIVPTAL